MEDLTLFYGNIDRTIRIFTYLQNTDFNAEIQRLYEIDTSMYRNYVLNTCWYWKILIFRPRQLLTEVIEHFFLRLVFIEHLCPWIVLFIHFLSCKSTTIFIIA